MQTIGKNIQMITVATETEGKRIDMDIPIIS